MQTVQANAWKEKERGKAVRVRVSLSHLNQERCSRARLFECATHGGIVWCLRLGEPAWPGIIRRVLRFRLPCWCSPVRFRVSSLAGCLQCSCRIAD
jgi:hypothetical protein